MILKDAKGIADAQMNDLVETYNALTGKSIKKFENRAIAERRVEMAMLASKDADAHTGVPKNGEPKVRTRDEIKAKAKERGIEPPPAFDDEAFPEGSLGDKLQAQAKEAPAIVPKPKAVKPPKSDRKRSGPIYAVQATYAGTTVLQAGSARNSILKRIQASPKGAATTEELTKHFEGVGSLKGELRKLVQFGHIVELDEAGYASATPAVAPEGGTPVKQQRRKAAESVKPEPKAPAKAKAKRQPKAKSTAEAAN